ncbi:unnamed protein product [Bursaphelenchus okinawaensis]|uniref:Timeless N-terminal domain-containing protein n=1 Tax=Bursaphelenchus okinawaensis TaxID=465554 RepID=A0A811KU71_9BILA|nr:unnamed protein product [Bursaphelenchus okinawaensis]CAG9111754.1 unnamed protein product [Bursaphelenchus okinawaensis]
MSETVVSATINSLGYLEHGVYQPEPDCLAGIHDLIRFLHGDTEEHSARRQCLAQNLLKNDLVPLMASSDINDEDFSLVLRLALNLVQPALAVFQFRLPETDEDKLTYSTLDELLVANINAFCFRKLFEKFNNKIKAYYNVDALERRETDKIVVDRIIMLIRCVFSIGMEGPKCTEISFVNVKSKRNMVDAFLSSGIGETLFTVTRNKMERELLVHILAIISLLFRSFPCESIAVIEEDESTRLEKDEELKAKIDLQVNRLALKRRHSHIRQLGSNYVVKNAALNKNNDLLVQKPLAGDPLELIKRRKHSKGAPKRQCVRNLVESVFKENRIVERGLAQKVRDFCVSMINTVFDKLMASTRDSAFSSNRQGLMIYNDVNYFSLASFVIEFIRLSRLPLEKVSFVLSKNFFNHIISQSDNYLDSFKTDKANAKLLTLRLQYSVGTFKEVCHMLYTISKSTDEKEKASYDEVCNYVYDQEEYREFCYHCLAALHAQTMTTKLLTDMVLGTHFFLAVMEKRYKQGHLDTLPEEELREIWDGFKDELLECVKGEIEPTEGLIPIDTALKVDDETHQIFALCQVQEALRDRRLLDAVGLFNASRDLWPDSAFGSISSTPEELMEMVNEIFTVDLRDEAKKYYDERAKIYDDKQEEENVGPSVSDDEEEKEKGVDNDSEEFEFAQIVFQFNDYVANFAKRDIIQWYIFLLRRYETNSDELNKACLKMLHRISFDLDSHARLYMASLFNIFLDVYHEFKTTPKEQWKTHRHFEIYQFGYFLIKHFFKHWEMKGERLIAELLFFKNAQECFDIQNSD